MNVKVNDSVLVIAGKYKNMTEAKKVIAADPKNNRVKVEGVNIQHKHEKARRANETSKIVDEEGYIDASNVMVVCAKCGKAVRVAHSIVDGKKVRVCPKCGNVLDVAYVDKKAAKEEVKAEAEAPKKRTRKRSTKAADKAETPVESTPAVTDAE